MVHKKVEVSRCRWCRWQVVREAIKVPPGWDTVLELFVSNRGLCQKI